MIAIITGSHAYGTPHEHSDLDLVVLVDPETLDKIASIAKYQGSDVPHSISVRFGILNLIATCDTVNFDMWKQATDDLKARAPVTRDEAIEHFTKLRKIRDEQELAEVLGTTK